MKIIISEMFYVLNKYIPKKIDFSNYLEGSLNLKYSTKKESSFKKMLNWLNMCYMKYIWNQKEILK